MKVKICGLKTKEAIETSITYHADFLGFIHHEPSPRHIAPSAMGKLIKPYRHETTEFVSVMVDPSTTMLETIITQAKPTMLQFHGHESPDFLRAAKEKYGLPVIKAIPIATEEDLTAIKKYQDAVDYLLFDTKSNSSNDYGGHGIAFDWNIIADLDLNIPYFLSGGLNCDNIDEAVKITGASYIDVSSGVESERGVKSLSKIENFLGHCLTLDSMNK